MLPTLPRRRAARAHARGLPSSSGNQGRLPRTPRRESRKHHAGKGSRAGWKPPSGRKRRTDKATARKRDGAEQPQYRGRVGASGREQTRRRHAAVPTCDAPREVRGGGSPVTMAAATATRTRARAPRTAARVSPVPPCRPPSTRPRPPGSPRRAPVPSRTRPGADTRTRTHAPGSLAHTPRPAPRAPRLGPSAEIGRRDAKPRIPREAARELLGNVVPAPRSEGRPNAGGLRAPPSSWRFRGPGRRRPPSAAPRPAVAQAGVF